MKPLTIPKARRIEALTKRQGDLYAAHYKATTDLEAINKELNIITAQLVVMSGLTDEVPPDGTD